MKYNLMKILINKIMKIFINIYEILSDENATWDIKCELQENSRTIKSHFLNIFQGLSDKRR